MRLTQDKEPEGNVIKERKASGFISTSVLLSLRYSTSTGASIPTMQVFISGLTRTSEKSHTSASNIVIDSILRTQVSNHCSVRKGLVLFPVVVPVCCVVMIEPFAAALFVIWIGVTLHSTQSWFVYFTVNLAPHVRHATDTAIICTHTQSVYRVIGLLLSTGCSSVVPSSTKG